MEISDVRHTVLCTPMNSRQPSISKRAHFVSTYTPDAYATCAEYSHRPKSEERIAKDFSPGNAYATKLPSKGVQARHEALLIIAQMKVLHC